MGKNTLVIGASDNSIRFSYLAVHRLRSNGHLVKAIGKHKGTVADVPIETEQQPYKDIDTVTLYINPTHQKEYYDYILALQPKRIIFNPGTENPELEELARNHNIATMEACTLVLLSTGQY